MGNEAELWLCYTVSNSYMNVIGTVVDQIKQASICEIEGCVQLVKWSNTIEVACIKKLNKDSFTRKHIYEKTEWVSERERPYNTIKPCRWQHR